MHALKFEILLVFNQKCQSLNSENHLIKFLGILLFLRSNSPCRKIERTCISIFFFFNFF